MACKSDLHETLTGSLQSTVGSQVGALHFQHVLLQNEVLLPQIDKVALQRAGDGSEIVQTRHSSINLERRNHKHLLQQHIVERSFIKNLLGLLLLHLRFQLSFQFLQLLYG